MLQEWTKKADKEYTQTATDLLRNDALHHKTSPNAEAGQKPSPCRSNIVGNDITEPNGQSGESESTLTSVPRTARRKSYSRESASGTEGQYKPLLVLASQ